MLTYREGKTLSDEGRERIKLLELKTGDPIRNAVAEAIDQGLIVDVDVDLFTYDLMILAQMWALKHWHFRTVYTLDEYIKRQTTIALRASLDPRRKKKYLESLIDRDSD